MEVDTKSDKAVVKADAVLAKTKINANADKVNAETDTAVVKAYGRMEVKRITTE